MPELVAVGLPSFIVVAWGIAVSAVTIAVAYLSSRP